MSEGPEVVTLVTEELLPKEFAALGDRAYAGTDAAIAGLESVGDAPDSGGRPNDAWAIVKHVFEVATFVKCVVDIAVAVRKNGRQVREEDIPKPPVGGSIYRPDPEEVKRVLAAVNRRLNQS
jgi:hypothetical protein